MVRKFRNIKVSGMSVALPHRQICILDELEYYGNSEKKAERAHRMAGFWKRRVAEPDVTSADLGRSAAERLIKTMALDRTKIEAMIMVVQQPDYAGPCTSYSVHHALGLSKDCFVTDVVQGCVGWCFGLLSAYQMIASGAYKSVLLINGDTPTKGVPASDRVNAPLFGDAGCATYVEYCEGAPETVFNLETYSEGFEALITLNPGQLGGRLGLDVRNPVDVKQLCEMFVTNNGRTACLADHYMDGAAVFEFSTERVPLNIRELMEEQGTSANEYDLLLLHQANKQIVQTIGCGVGFPPEKVPFSGFENFGNATMCSIPVTLLFERKDALLSSEGTHILASGFGNGLVVCSCDICMSGLRCAEMFDFKKPSDHKTNQEWVAYWRHKFQNT